MSKAQKFRAKEQELWVSRNRLKIGGEGKVSLMDFYRASLSKETIKRDLIV